MKKEYVFCTECNTKVPIKRLIVSNNLNQGCNYYGHVISKKILKEIKNDKYRSL